MGVGREQKHERDREGTASGSTVASGSHALAGVRLIMPRKTRRTRHRDGGVPSEESLNCKTLESLHWQSANAFPWNKMHKRDL